MPVRKRRAPPKPRRKKAAAGSKGLTPLECRLTESHQALLAPVLKAVSDAGGEPLAGYREPLSGHPVALAILPLKAVEPTPFQRELSEAHSKRLVETIDKLGLYVDPIVAVPADGKFWTPNGMHRLAAMKKLGAKSITALVLPEPELQFKILALNVEKAHNLKDKSLEVVRMYRALASRETSLESRHALEFEEPAFATLGPCYERNKRFGGGAYHPILKRVDEWLDEPLPAALRERLKRSVIVEALDAEVARAVKALEARGFKSPYLKSFVIARVNPLRFMETPPPFDEAFELILGKAKKFDPERVRQEDLASAAGAASD